MPRKNEFNIALKYGLGLKSKHGRGEGGKASLRECRGYLKGMSRGGEEFCRYKINYFGGMPA